MVVRIVVLDRSEKRENLLLLPALHIFTERRIYGFLLRAVAAELLGFCNQTIIDGKVSRHVLLHTLCYTICRGKVNTISRVAGELIFEANFMAAAET